MMKKIFCALILMGCGSSLPGREVDRTEIVNHRRVVFLKSLGMDEEEKTVAALKNQHWRKMKDQDLKSLPLFFSSHNGGKTVDEVLESQ